MNEIQNNETQDPDKEFKKRKFEVREVSSVQDLISTLELKGADKVNLFDAEVLNNLKNLFDATLVVGKKLFIVETNEGAWAVVASSQEEVRRYQSQVEEISLFESKLVPKRLWGRCTVVHEFAYVEGISDGVISANKPTVREKSIFPDMNFHDIGFKQVDKKSIYFDLTAKVYSFTRVIKIDKRNLERGDAEKAILEGLITIDDVNDTSTIQALFQSKWTKYGLNLDFRARRNIIESIRDEGFLKSE